MTKTQWRGAFVLLASAFCLALPWQATAKKICLLAAVPPYPRHIPRFDQLVVNGYTITQGQPITFRGLPKRIRPPLGGSIQAYGKKAVIGSWFIPASGETRRISVILETDPGSFHAFPIDEILKSPEIQAAYSAATLRVRERRFEAQNYIWLDRFKDPDTSGYINRVVVDSSITNYQDAEHSGGYVIYKFAKNFKLAAKLGFAVDTSRSILYYPDERSFNARLQKVYRQWGVTDGIGSQEVNGELPARDFARLIATRNVMPRSGFSNYEVHWHDLDSHTLGWIASVEVMKIVRERLQFLFAADDLAQDYIESHGDEPQPVLKFQEQIHSLIDSQEVYQTIEVGMPDGRAVTGLLDPEAEKRDLWRSRIKWELIRAGAKSASDVKSEALRMPLPEDFRRSIDSIVTSTQHIDEAEGEAILQRVVQRFR